MRLQSTLLINFLNPSYKFSPLISSFFRKFHNFPLISWNFHTHFINFSTMFSERRRTTRTSVWWLRRRCTPSVLSRWRVPWSLRATAWLSTAEPITTASQWMRIVVHSPSFRLGITKIFLCKLTNNKSAYVRLT